MSEKQIRPIEEIEEDRLYSVMDALPFMPFKTRQAFVRHIKKKNILALAVNEGTQKRYSIKGKWLISFLERYNRGVYGTRPYSDLEIKTYCRTAIYYARKMNFTTIDELEHHVETSID